MDMDFALFQQITACAGDERNTSARFYDKAVKTSNLTANGLPIFKNVTYVEIRLKDNSTEVYNQPATAEKIKRFPKEYALYKMSKEQSQNGTPLEMFAFLTVAEIATCKNRGIFTVEALADLDFEKVQSLGLQNEHIMAQMFVEQSEKNNSLQNMETKIKQYENKIAGLNLQIENLQKQLKFARHKEQK